MGYDRHHGPIEKEIALFDDFGHVPMSKLARAIQKQKWIDRLAFQHSAHRLFIQVMDWEGGSGSLSGHFLVIYNDGPELTKGLRPTQNPGANDKNSYDFFDAIHDTETHGLTREEIINRLDKALS